MRRYDITGMSCAACSSRVEKAVSKLAGVESCSVNLLTNSMSVEGSAPSAKVIAAVEAAGYGASEKESGGLKQGQNSCNAADIVKGKEALALRRRLFWSLGFLAALMYVSMGHMMFGWPLPPFLAGNHVAVGMAQMLLSAAILVINQKFFVGGIQSVIHGAPNMDTLVALGSGASFLWSVYVLFAMTFAQARGDLEGVISYSHGFYFESAAMILTLITVGKMLEERSKGRAADALKALMALSPKTARVIRGGKEEVVQVSQVQRGDVFVVRPGECVPADGIVIEGRSSVNESALTGEGIPVDKEAGDGVSAATINQSGFLRCRAERVGEDTALSQIIRMTCDAAATKAPIAKAADAVSGIFVPAVLAVAAAAVAAWLFFGASAGDALERGIAVLVISCPCALGLATPVAIMVGSGLGAKNGILFKTAESLEQAGKIRVVALDKTGTITHGSPVVTDILPKDGVRQEELLRLAADLEERSEHPLAKAVMDRARADGIAVPEGPLEEFAALPGNGLSGRRFGRERAGGSMAFISEKAAVPDGLRRAAESFAAQGKTPLFFSEGGEVAGIIAVSDAVKADSADAVRTLKDMGIRTVMLTGDNARTAAAVGAAAGIDEVFAGVLPDGKADAVKSLGKYGVVAMVGDGINDAPALALADVGIAIGAGTDVAIDAADVVLMRSSLADVPCAIRLGRATLRTIYENLFWAFFYNVIGIPLAAGVWIPLFGWKLGPMFGAAAMSLSSVCVVMNALRLNLFDVRRISRKKNRTADGSKLREDIKAEGMEEKMEKILKIEGMMCGHCEGQVKKALESLDGVSSAVVSREQGTASVFLSGGVSDGALKAAVEAAGYKAVSVS